MGLFTRDIKTMDDLFMHTLQDIYYAEHQITKALPKMIEKATDPAAQTGLPDPSFGDREPDQAARPSVPDARPEAQGRHLRSHRRIIDEAESIIGNVADKEVLDAAMLSSAQAVEHYEITRYGTLAAWAKDLGRGDCASLLHQTLDEEKATDEKLTQLAKSRLNRKAA